MLLERTGVGAVVRWAAAIGAAGVSKRRAAAARIPVAGRVDSLDVPAAAVFALRAPR